MSSAYLTDRAIRDWKRAGAPGSEAQPERARPTSHQMCPWIQLSCSAGLPSAWAFASLTRSGWLQGTARSANPHTAATHMISTRYFGEASRASTVARAGVLAGSTQASQAAFMSA